MPLADLCTRRGDAQAAVEALARGAEIKEPAAFYAQAERANEAGDHTATVDLLTRAADAGSADAARVLAGIAPDDQRGSWLQRALDLGDPDAAGAVAATSYRRADVPAALAASLVAARAGDPKSAFDVGTLLAELDRAGSEGWWRRAADAGVVAAAERLAGLSGARGDDGARLHWLRRATELGSERASDVLGHVLVRGGDPAALAEAEPLLVASHGRGDPDAAWALARIARAQGRDAEADHWTALVPPDCAPAAVSRAEAPTEPRTRTTRAEPTSGETRCARFTIAR